MTFSITHPCLSHGECWLKGNLHTHTTRSDGNLPPQETILAYKALGHDFIMFSDHDTFTDPAEFDNHGLTIIPGCEITAGGPHLLHVNACKAVEPLEDRQRVIDHINSNGGFAICNHPNWLETFNHCDQSFLETWQGYAGIEIYNGVTRRAEGSPLATDRWDRLLSAGRRVWGYANDDNHRDHDRNVAWNVVDSKENSVAAIVSALRTGRFYASTGVVIDSIQVEHHTIIVRTRNAQRIYVGTMHGRVAEIVDGRELVYTVPGDFPYDYVRIECYGPGDAMAWTQPFFIERP